MIPYGVLVEWYWQGIMEAVSLSFYTPQNPHGMAWVWFWASVMTCLRPNSWVLAWRNSFSDNVFFFKKNFIQQIFEKLMSDHITRNILDLRGTSNYVFVFSEAHHLTLPRRLNPYPILANYILLMISLFSCHTLSYFPTIHHNINFPLTPESLKLALHFKLCS